MYILLITLGRCETVFFFKLRIKILLSCDRTS